MKALICIYRVAISLIFATLLIFGIKAILSLKNDPIYWLVMGILAIGACFVVLDSIHSQKDKKKQIKMNKMSNSNENDPNEREKLLLKLHEEYSNGYITENRLFLIYFNNSDCFLYCDVLKNIIGISDSKYKKYFGSMNKNERFRFITMEIDKIIDDKICLLNFSNVEGEIVKSVPCEAKFIDETVKKEKNQMNSFGIIEKCIRTLFLAYPEKIELTEIITFSGKSI